jgi:hypothetical protein
LRFLSLIAVLIPEATLTNGDETFGGRNHWRWAFAFSDDIWGMKFPILFKFINFGIFELKISPAAQITSVTIF